MKKVILYTTLLATTLTFANCHKSKAKPVANLEIPATVKDGNTKIQVALLLDTSNSMDGLIEQAKSRLWHIVNTLTTLKYNGKTPDILKDILIAIQANDLYRSPLFITMIAFYFVTLSISFTPNLKTEFQSYLSLI